MKTTIKLVRNAEGAHFDRQELAEDVLAVEFVDGEGKTISVMIRRGVVEVSTVDGALLVRPEAANAIFVSTKPF